MWPRGSSAMKVLSTICVTFVYLEMAAIHCLLGMFSFGRGSEQMGTYISYHVTIVLSSNNVHCGCVFLHCNSTVKLFVKMQRSDSFRITFGKFWHWQLWSSLKALLWIPLPSEIRWVVAWLRDFLVVAPTFWNSFPFSFYLSPVGEEFSVLSGIFSVIPSSCLKL